MSAFSPVGTRSRVGSNELMGFDSLREASEDERPRVYDERDGDDHDPRGGLMRDVDLPRRRTSTNYMRCLGS